MTVDAQPTAGLVLNGMGGAGTAEFLLALHAGLTVYDERGNLLPRIAQSVPSVEDGDWKVFPDGRMEVTWKLRPDVRWHDGVGLTADDYVFGMQVITDPEVPATRPRAAQFISQVSAPDAETLVLVWKSTYFLANSGALDSIVALPRHLLGDLYERGERAAFSNNPYWTYQFVGLGPYQMARWEPGSTIELEAFDPYFLGRPRIDRVIYQFRGNADVALTALLAGEADMVGMGAFKPTSLPSLKAQIETPGKGTVLGVFRGTRNLEPQFRDPTAPWARDVRVREALIRMLDRQTLVDSLMEGSTDVAHTLPAADDPLYPLLVQRGLATYPFDLRRSQALLDEAGWTRGPSGAYRSESGGELALEVRTTAIKPGAVEETEALAYQFRAAGVSASTFHIQDEATNKPELRGTYTGFLSGPRSNGPEFFQRYLSSQIASPQTRWSGSNGGAYSDPTFDQLYDRYATTLQPASRLDLLADILKFEADQILSFYIYYDMGTSISASHKGLSGPGPVPPFQTAQAWNIHTWVLE
jgi:peptide/nickel transport system substrate-binding protein